MEAVTPQKPTRTIEAVLAGLTAIGPLSIDMYLPALPSIARDYGVSVDQVQLSLSSFFVGLALGQLLTGPLLDRFGRKKPLLLGLALYLLGSVACGLSPTVEWLTFARFIQALGGAAALVASRSIVRDLASGAEAARLLSRMIAIMGIAPILAPLLGGWVLVGFGWQGIFAILAVFGTLMFWAVVRLIPETAPKHQKTETTQMQITQLFRDPDFLRASLVGAFVQAGMFAYISGSPFVFIEVFGVPAKYYGILFGTNAAGLITMAQLNRYYVSKFDFRDVIRVATLIAAVSGVYVAIVGATGLGGLWGLLPGLFVFVSTLGAITPNTVVLALENHGSRAGTASAVLGAIQFGIAATSSGIVAALHDGTAVPMTATIAGFAFLSFATMRLPSRKATTV